MTFADFRSPSLLTDAQAEFVASKYRIVSLEKCTGAATTKTEEAIYSTARQLKKKDPTTKVIFYLATDQQGIGCYKANDEFKVHPEWHLKDDKGTEVPGPVLDCSNAEARNWWTRIPLSGVDNTGEFEGTPVSELIDGVLAGK